MLFNSIDFLIFFPAVCLLHFAIPQKARSLFLLVCSYYFYMCWNPKYALLMLSSTVITFASGLLIDYANKFEEPKSKRLKHLWVALSFSMNLLILFFFKYYGFASRNATTVLGLLGVQIQFPAIDVILPVGISFYTFQALSYTMDVYRKEIYAEKNFIRYALFVSFFPQLVAGPIERSKNLLVQIDRPKTFDWIRIRRGMLLMLYGYFQKVVLSSYLALAVDAAYNDIKDATGFQLLIATILFAFQIYCDFGGYSNIAIGAANVLGFDLMENFNTPYLARSVAEFWHRWHISLSTWFRDYLYIPLGGNRKGKLRKHINIMITFLVSGLWHGASWSFVVWGGLNGLFQVMGEVFKPITDRINELFKVDTDSISHRVFKTITTFVLIDFTWIFFRASSFRDGLRIIRKIFSFGEAGWITWGSNIKGLDLTTQTLNILILSLVILIIADLFKYKGVEIRSFFLSQPLWLRWAFIYAAIFFVLIFGVYGPGYDAAEFIYFQF